MSAVQLHCPLCEGLFQVDDSLAGMEVNCPHCAGLVTVPLEAAEPPPQTAFDLHCPMCMGQFQVTLDMSGQEVNCPHCQQVVSVPDLRDEVLWEETPPQEADSSPQSKEAVTNEALYPPGYAPPQAEPSLDDLLPPAIMGASASAASVDDPLLPPIAGEVVAPPSDVPSPPPIAENERKPLPAPIPSRPKDTILIPTEHGLVGVHEPVKTVMYGGEEVELRQLSPDEKARRRVLRNTVFVVFCLVVLIGVMLVLSRR
jgi:hypothetical protein